MVNKFTLNSKKTVQDIVNSVRGQHALPAQPQGMIQDTQYTSQATPPAIPQTQHVPNTQAQQSYPGQSPKQSNVIQFDPRKALAAQRAGKGF